MFLTQVLEKFGKLPRRFPKGNIWRGKYRLVRKVTGLDVAQVRNELIREDKNMFYLRNPYLTAKEYEPVGKNFLEIPRLLHEKWRGKQIEKFKKTEETRKLNVYLTRSLGSKDAWE